MGRIFSYEEISKDQVPESGEFVVAKEHFARSLEAYIDEGTITGGFIYGSVAIDLANRRSDFDTFLSVRSLASGLDAAQGLVEDVKRKTKGKIPISPIVQTRDSLQTGRHEMDRFFGEHLTSGYRYILGVDPAESMYFSASPADAIVSGYLAQKKRRLMNTYVAVDPLDVAEGGLQRMLELPVAVGRKALQALAETNHIEQAVTKTADKAQVIQAIRKVLKAEKLHTGFNQILDLNQLYNTSLDRAIEGRGNQKNYEKVLTEIHTSLPVAIDWIEQLEKVLLPKLASPES